MKASETRVTITQQNDEVFARTATFSNIIFRFGKVTVLCFLFSLCEFSTYLPELENVKTFIAVLHPPKPEIHPSALNEDPLLHQRPSSISTPFFLTRLAVIKQEVETINEDTLSCVLGFVARFRAGLYDC